MKYQMSDKVLSDIIQWDVKSWSKAISYWDENVNWDEVKNCLELGGHQGGLSLWLALKGKNSLCSDLRDTKQTAEQLHIKYNVGSLIEYRDIDATEIPFENHFDVITFKSIIGGIGRDNHIERQQRVFKEIFKALKPGGKLLFAENLVASPLHQRMRRRYVNWGNSWRYVSIKEMEMFLEDFSSFHIKTTGVLGTFGRNEKQRIVLSAIDSFILNRISPRKWKYIAYGIAEK